MRFIEAYENAFINQNRDWNQSCQKAWNDWREEELANPFFKEAASLSAGINASLTNWGFGQKQQHLFLFIWEQCTKFLFWTLHKRIWHRPCARDLQNNVTLCSKNAKVSGFECSAKTTMNFEWYPYGYNQIPKKKNFCRGKKIKDFKCNIDQGFHHPIRIGTNVWKLKKF